MNNANMRLGLFLLLCVSLVPICSGMATGKTGPGPAAEAIDDSDLQQMRRIAAEMSVGQLDEDLGYGQTPLHRAVGVYAAISGHLDKPFEPDHISDPKSRELLLRQRRNYEHRKPRALEIVELLLQHGANVDAVNSAGRTPLLSINHYYRPRTRLMTMLVKYGASGRAVDRDGNGLLHLVLRHSAADFDFEPILDLDVDVNLRNAEGETPLMLAAISKSEKTIQLFLDRGMDFKATSHSGATALHYAARFNNWRAVELLVEAGADLEARDRRGGTPLSHAVSAQQWSMARRLLEKGANANVALDSSGRTVADLILTRPALGLGELVTARTFDASRPVSRGPAGFGIEVSVLANAIRDANLALVGKYLDLGADPNMGGGTPHAPLVLAADHLPDIWASVPEWEPTPSQVKQSRDADAILHLLLERGADANVHGVDGNTALMVAARWRNAEGVIELLKHGARIDAVDSKGATALMQALKDQRWSMARLLIARGGDVTLCPNSSSGTFCALGLAWNAYRASLQAEKFVFESPGTFDLSERPSLAGELEFRLLYARAWVAFWSQRLTWLLRRSAHPYLSGIGDGENVDDSEYSMDEFKSLLLAIVRALPEDYVLDLDNALASSMYISMFSTEYTANDVRDPLSRLKVRFAKKGSWSLAVKYFPEVVDDLPPHARPPAIPDAVLDKALAGIRAP